MQVCNGEVKAYYIVSNQWTTELWVLTGLDKILHPNDVRLRQEFPFPGMRKSIPELPGMKIYVREWTPPLKRSRNLSLMITHFTASLHVAHTMYLLGHSHAWTINWYYWTTVTACLLIAIYDTYLSQSYIAQETEYEGVKTSLSYSHTSLRRQRPFISDRHIDFSIP